MVDKPAVGKPGFVPCQQVSQLSHFKVLIFRPLALSPPHPLVEIFGRNSRRPKIRDGTCQDLYERRIGFNGREVPGA